MPEPGMNDCDIAIVGAGPVGLALALLLVRRGVDPARLLLLDARAADVAAGDPRSLALSFGSRQILDDIGAWGMPATPIDTIHVSRRARFGRTLIEAREYRLPALGYVVRYGGLATALTAAAQRAGIRMLRPTQARIEQEDDRHITLRLTDGARIAAAVAIQAEGGLFSDQEAKPTRRDYGQTALVAEVRVDRPIAHRAFERFTDEGPLALLPLDGGYALVWCVTPERASSLLSLPDAGFLAALQDTFGDRLGRFIHTSRPVSYPLGLNADTMVAGRRVAIGNAAQTLHPVAGQGLNLGLRDAVVLARLLARESSPAMLARFAAERSADRSLTVRLTDTMATVFTTAARLPLPQSVLGLSLGLLDAIPPVKRLLAEQMMFGRR